MPTTTIPWGDGSGDNIYLSYPSATGNQTVDVSSDANSGSTSRIKTVTFNASGVSPVVLTVSQAAGESYIVFADATVGQICATNWGDGTGITPTQASQVTNTQFGTTFRNNTAITSFDELSYFTGLTQLNNYAFGGCTGLESVTIPSTVTSLGQYCFNGCSSLSSLIVPSTVTSIGTRAFNGLSSISSLIIYSNAGLTILHFSNSGNGSGELSVAGNMTGADYQIYFKKLVFGGNYSFANYQSFRCPAEQIRIKGNLTSTTTQTNQYRGIIRDNSFGLAFFEVMGTVTATQNASVICYSNTIIANGLIVHLGYDTVSNNALPCGPLLVSANNTKVAKIYVGDGTSASHDNAILAQYVADSNWSAYTSKLDTWYNYVNDPDANPDFIN